MARIETDPNYTAPTFSRATAATDLFKKTDVQDLAAAMSTHNHTAGKGLVLAAGAIPSGLITSDMILNGTIATADIAANAVSQVVVAEAVTSDPTTTSGSFVDLPGMTAVIDTAGGRVLAFLVSSYTLTSVVGNVITQGLAMDGGADLGPQGASPSALNFQIANVSMADFGAPAAGAHTIKGRWAVSGGATAVAISANRRLIVIEFKR